MTLTHVTALQAALTTILIEIAVFRRRRKETDPNHHHRRAARIISVWAVWDHHWQIPRDLLTRKSL